MIKRILLTLILFCVFTSAAMALTMQYDIHGATGNELDNVQKRLLFAEKEFKLPLSTSTLQQIYQQAPDEAIKALEPFGYFHAKVRSQLFKQNNSWITRLFIILGPRTTIIHLSIHLSGPGENSPALQEYLQTVPRRLGTLLDTPKYEKVKQHFFDIAQEDGYVKAYFSKSVIQVDKQKNTASIELLFETGPRYYFGMVYFSKTPLTNEFLQRFIPFKMGAPYSQSKILKLQSNLTSSIYFKEVRVEPLLEKIPPNNLIPVNVNLQPNKPHQYSVGIGYGTDTGIRGSAGWEWRYVTPSGHYIQASAQLTQYENDNVQIQYVIPGKNPVTDHYSLLAGYITNAPANGKYHTEQIGANYVILRNDWQQTLALQYQHENFTDNINDGLTDSSDTIIPSIAWERVSANDRINVRNGYRLYLLLQAGAVSPASASFLQAEFQGKYIHSFNQQRQRLILRTDLGATSVKDFSNMPLSQRFFSGGAQSIRGFNYQQFGPGRYLIVGSAEVQQQLCGKIYGSLFYDAGNSLENLPIQLNQSAGVGVLYRSLIGSLELTVAHPLDQDWAFKRRSLALQFVMGADL